MTEEHTLPGVDQLLHQHDTFTTEAFRLETLQSYSGSGEDDGIAAFQRGDATPPPDPAEDEYAAMLRTQTAQGRIHRRVHVVAEPISDYMAYELCWEYGPHVAAGEDIRIIPVTDTWPAGVPQQEDFFLFDSAHLFEQLYADDGYWNGTRPTDSPERVDRARRIRDRAMELAIPWSDYITRHPELVKRLPKDA